MCDPVHIKSVGCDACSLISTAVKSKYTFFLTSDFWHTAHLLWYQLLEYVGWPKNYASGSEILIIHLIYTITGGCSLEFYWADTLLHTILPLLKTFMYITFRQNDHFSDLQFPGVEYKTPFNSTAHPLQMSR